MTSVVGDAVAAACRDPDVLKHLGGPLGETARAKAAELRKLRDSKRERAMAAAIVRAPIPAGLRSIHPSWIVAALAELPARAREDFATGGMRGKHVDEVGVWLARWVSSELAPITTNRELVRPKSIVEATQLTVERLEEWLAEVGADQVAFAVGAGAALKIDRVTRAMKRIESAPRVGKLGERRAAIERAGTQDLVIVGARAIAPYTDAIVRRQLVMRMPRTRGREVLFELRAWCHESVGASPTWDAISAT